MSLNIYKW